MTKHTPDAKHRMTLHGTTILAVRRGSHVALAGARKLVGAGAAPLLPGGVCASPGVIPRPTTETTTTTHAKEVVRMSPPEIVPATT